MPPLQETKARYSTRKNTSTGEATGTQTGDQKAMNTNQAIKENANVSTTDKESNNSTTSTTTTTNRSQNMGTESQQRGMSRTIPRRRRTIRSRSAPADFQRKNQNRRRLVEQHFKIDKENLALLPGVPAHDDDLARDLHDFFNLIVLVPIVVLNILNWDWDELFYGRSSSSSSSMDDNIPFVHAWTGEYFHIFFWTTVAYFTIDLIWVWAIPKCVKSPSTIIQHHLAVFVYLVLPYFLPKVRFLMGVLMSVELNTWFLIARRVFNKQGYPPWKLDIPYFISVRVKLISIFFYITWITIRCVMYPYVLYVLAFPLHRSKAYADVNKHVVFAILIQSVFCFLNGKWSLQLLNSKIRQWKKNGETQVASGL